MGLKTGRASGVGPIMDQIINHDQTFFRKHSSSQDPDFLKVLDNHPAFFLV
jgi:hypothetical protein